jgi:hypothetical protein
LGGAIQLSQSTTDETDFEPSDPNGCIGKSLTTCKIKVTRKTATVTGMKKYILEWEDEADHVKGTSKIFLEGR